MSAITFLHRLYSKSDPCEHFMFKKLMVGFSKLDPRVDNRLPLTLPLLHQMVLKIPDLGLIGYHQFIFKVMLLVSFAAY